MVKMVKKNQSPEKPQAHPIHPETKKQTQRVPGDESSKARDRGEDARTSQDKDGNEGQASKGRSAIDPASRTRRP